MVINCGKYHDKKSILRHTVPVINIAQLYYLFEYMYYVYYYSQSKHIY